MLCALGLSTFASSTSVQAGGIDRVRAMAADKALELAYWGYPQEYKDWEGEWKSQVNGWIAICEDASKVVNRDQRAVRVSELRRTANLIAENFMAWVSSFSRVAGKIISTAGDSVDELEDYLDRDNISGACAHAEKLSATWLSRAN